MDNSTFWNIRSDKYDRLFWTKDFSYIDKILRVSEFKKSDVVLDVGTGTGIIAQKVRPLVNQIIALDNSSAMLSKGKWEGCSFVKWDIAEKIFADNMFDKVIARMVFHHIFEDLYTAFIRCLDLLREKGLLIVAEGVPPTDESEIIQWYTEMFKLKEKRRVFSKNELLKYFRRTGYKDVRSYTHIMENFSIGNWLENSGLKKEVRKEILDIHLKASPKVKKAYNMKIRGDDCLVDTKNIIITGKKGC